MDYEQTLTIVNDTYAYRVPPTVNISNFKCAEWQPSDMIFQGKIKVLAKGVQCLLELVKEDGTSFTRIPVQFRGAIPVIERATDSSRYFILIVKDEASGRVANVGLGFKAREGAFDFKVALGDHGKWLQRRSQKKTSVDRPKVDFSLKEGQKIRVALPGQGMDKKSKKPSARVTSFAPPPGAAPRTVHRAPAPAASTDDWGF
eukprot:gnl/Dysnectes_brevis/2069_a2391_1588.p1 GENE.gnl/Dysnectes_brevis/2069_a2391_1588~~gnl/Dysnectes_brevis/2069_a2391_1588.p1  ORF type:complete len:202 (+),score=21.55 gnl/Dysnectes_brevis/2069_a2391_1588:1769-2374(+)